MDGARQKIVVAGLDPTIHLSKGIFRFLMDARVEPAHDGREVGVAP
jgi:hypothetical protein